MKEKKFMKRLTACLLAAAMVIASVVPASAATTYKRTVTKSLVDTGQSYHIMNSDINGNKISKYQIVILPLEEGTRVDFAWAYSGNEMAIKNFSFGPKKQYLRTSVTNTYIKSSSTSNSGMLACLKVIKGSVKVSVTYNTTNKNAKLSFVKQAASHQTLKGVTVKTGRKVLFQQKGSNITQVPLVIASRKGSVTRRDLTGVGNFETFTFGTSYVTQRYYNNNILKKTSNNGYDTVLGTTGHLLLRMKNRISGWLTTKSGTMTYYYPTDYLKISATLK